MKILIIKLNHIGDTLLITPTLRKIKNQYPTAIIDVLVRRGCEGVLINNEDINEVVSIAAPEKKNRTFKNTFKDITTIFNKFFLKKYDFTFDLNNTDRARIINLISFSKVKVVNSWHTNLEKSSKRFFYTDFINYAWGKNHQVLKDYYTIKPILNLDDDIPSLYINTDSVKSEILEFFELEKESYFVIHPTTRWTFKQWEVNKWREVIKFINSLGYKVLLSCGPNENEQKYIKSILTNDSYNISTLGRTSLLELAFLIQNSKQFIGVDTAATHISAAVKTPSIVLFGPTDEWSWFPWQTKHELILAECDCKSKRKITCDKSKVMPCMKMIDVDSLINSIMKLV